jgi:hypothetical protein
MTPTIPSRSAVLVHKDHYHVGQVVSFETAAGIVTHRVVKRSIDGSLRTKRDGNKDNDVNVVQPVDVIGGAVVAPRELGYWIVYLENSLGLGSVVATRVCVGLIWSIAMSFETPKVVRGPGSTAHHRDLWAMRIERSKWSGARPYGGGGPGTARRW